MKKNSWNSNSRSMDRTGSHCKETEITILWAHDQSTEPLHTYLWRSSRWRTAEEGQGDDGEMIYKTGLGRRRQIMWQQQETGRAGENLCVVLRSPTFSNEGGNVDDDNE